jgi:hypothetical protein
MYKIYENSLPIELEDYVYDELTSHSFPWYKSENGYKTVTTNYNSNIIWSNISEGTQLCHQFIHLDKTKDNSFSKKMIISMLQCAINHIAPDWKITEVNVLRSKANIQLNNYNSQKRKLHNPPHIDSLNNHLVLLYYVNDSDGDTIIFDLDDKTKKLASISPKKGRLVVFNGEHYHASSPPTKFDSRIVINTNIELLY